MFAATERSSRAAFADSHEASAGTRRHGEINVTKTRAIEPKNMLGESDSLVGTTDIGSFIYA